LLFTGTDGYDESDTAKIVGPYPTFSTNAEGRTVPICQAFEYGKYLGHIDLTFYLNGNRYVLHDEIRVSRMNLIFLMYFLGELVGEFVSEW